MHLLDAVVAFEGGGAAAYFSVVYAPQAVESSGPPSVTQTLLFVIADSDSFHKWLKSFMPFCFTHSGIKRVELFIVLNSISHLTPTS